MSKIEEAVLLQKFREWAAAIAMSNAHEDCEVAEAIAHQIRTLNFPDPGELPDPSEHH